MITRRDFAKTAAAAAVAGSVPNLAHASPPKGVELLMKHDGIGLAGLVRSGQVSPKELIEASIKAIEALDGKLNALPVRDFERALDRASSIRPQGPFAGVPFAIKDTAKVAGLPNALGVKFFAKRVPKHSDGLVRLYEAAGLIVLGITNTPEMSLLPTTEGGHYGTTKNPWNLDYSSGGSSGGASAAVAAGYMPMAHGTDGAGSIRGPASHCGLFGLKPGLDRVLPANSTPRFAYDHVLSRTVRDSALTLAISQNRSPDIPLERMGFIKGPNKRRLKIGFHLNSYTVAPTPDVKAAVEDTARLCQSLGHEIVETRQNIDRDEYEKNYSALYAINFLKVRRTIEEATGKSIAETGLMTKFGATFGNLADGLTAEDFDAANAYLASEKQKFDSWMTEFDVVLSPVNSAPPPRLGFLFDESEDYSVVSRRIFDYLGYGSPHNAFALSAMSVPLHISPEGLPIGSHFAAKHGQEPMLLELAYELEAARPWKDKWAPNSIASL